MWDIITTYRRSNAPRRKNLNYLVFSIEIRLVLSKGMHENPRVDLTISAGRMYFRPQDRGTEIMER
jgi:hypothetical protein